MKSGRVILITGVSSGIGYESALAFSRRGDHVVGTARRVDRLTQLSEVIQQLPPGHGDFLPIQADVRDGEAMSACVEQIRTRFGRLDVVVANAGVGHRGGIIESDWETIESLLRTNIDGVLHTIRSAVPLMRGGQGGHIIVISSVVYNMTAPYTAGYAASKSFISSMAKSLRLELESDHIRVIDMRIGRTETEFSQRRLGQQGRSSSKGVPVMTPQIVAEAVVKASLSNRKTVAIRWFDRLLMVGNSLFPELIGRRAMKQYR